MKCLKEFAELFGEGGGLFLCERVGRNGVSIDFGVGEVSSIITVI